MAAVTNPLFEPRICTWEDLSFTEAENLLQKQTSNKAIHNQIATFELLPTTSITSQNDKLAEKRIKITQDLFYNMILFSRKHTFNPEQLTALFTIFKAMHLLCISTPYDNMEECFQMVQSFIVKHSVFRPPYSICLFNLNEVKLISEYILQTYFKHYKMYKYAFTKRVILDLHFSYEGDAIQRQDSARELEEKESENKVDESQEETGVPGKESNTSEEATLETQEIEEEETLSEDQKQLRDMISQTLSDRMNEMKIIVEKELGLSDKRLAERLSVLEAEMDKGKGKKKK